MSDTEYIIIAFPNGSEGSGATMRSIEKAIGGTSSDSAEVYHFEIPTMRVGTLDKLMSAGDSLSKVDTFVEGVLRKIERSFHELNDSGEDLTVDGGPVVPYLQNFRWATAKYQATRPIEELVKLISQSIQKIDDELKEAIGAYQESKHELQALQRKKGGNLMANIGEYVKDIDPEVFLETEYLSTVLIVVQKNSEKQFLEQYENLANDAVGYGPPENRQEILGSPVVPRSAKKIAEDKDGYFLYAVNVLKSYKDVYSQACSKARFAVRELTTPSSSTTTEDEESIETRYAAVEIEYDQCKNQLRRWAKTHYGEAFIAWMHIKAIRVFVEAVLLYGLPVDFVAALVKPKKKNNEKKIRDRLSKLYQNAVGDDLGAAASNEPAKAGDAYFPYVSLSFKPIATE